MKPTTAFKKGRVRAKSDDLPYWETLVETNLVTESESSRERIFASSAALCERQTAGLVLLPTDSVSRRKASSQFYFKLGNAVEDVMAMAFERAGVMVDRETRVEFFHGDLPVSGRIDFVLEDPKHKLPVLMELKTCGKLPRSPKHPHEAQLRTYLAMTGMPRGLLWYVSRTVAGWNGDLIQKTFDIVPTEAERRNTILTVALGAVYSEAGFLPDIPGSMKQYQCGFCPLIPYCWNGVDIGIKAKEPTTDDRLALLKQANVIVEEVMDQQAELRDQFMEAVYS